MRKIFFSEIVKKIFFNFVIFLLALVIWKYVKKGISFLSQFSEIPKPTDAKQFKGEFQFSVIQLWIKISQIHLCSCVIPITDNSAAGQYS